MELHCEDALRFLIEGLRRNSEAFARGDRPPSYDIWIPNVVDAFLRSASVESGGDPEYLHREEFSAVWIAFYDAAWQMCRTGIFRLALKRPEGMGSHMLPLGDGYSLTTVGRDWLRRAEPQYFPTEPSRYVGVLERPAKILGDGFLQRAAEAAGCNETGNYLACCAMCGAAAESVLLSIAIAKTERPDIVLATYMKRDGRRNVMKLIFGPHGSSALEARFLTGFNLLSYWRDEAAHGQYSTIVALEAHDALGRLLHLSYLAWDHWTELTGKPLPQV
jgi:hypothetical protein